MKFLNYGNTETVSQGFYTCHPEDEFLKPLSPDSSFEAIETQYFGFNIPEHQINGEFYIWHHPALKITSGGFICWKGHKTRQLSADYQDYRWFMPMPERTDVFTLANGVTIRFIEPLTSVELSFEDKDQNTSVQVLMTAVMPAAGRGNGGHFTQAMRTEGRLRLRGIDYSINGFYTRDHSWGEFRTEAPLNIPELSWVAGVFNADFAFHLTAFDSAEFHPEWAGVFEGPEPGQNLRWGYIWKGGTLRNILSCRKRTYFAPGGLLLERMELDVTDSQGEDYRIVGTATATYPWMSWSNMHCAFALTRWECIGQTGWGDVQNCLWNVAMRRIEAAGGAAIPS